MSQSNSGRRLVGQSRRVASPGCRPGIVEPRDRARGPWYFAPFKSPQRRALFHVRFPRGRCFCRPANECRVVPRSRPASASRPRVGGRSGRSFRGHAEPGRLDLARPSLNQNSSRRGKIRGAYIITQWPSHYAHLRPRLGQGFLLCLAKPVRAYNARLFLYRRRSNTPYGRGRKSASRPKHAKIANRAGRLGQDGQPRRAPWPRWPTSPSVPAPKRGRPTPRAPKMANRAGRLGQVGQVRMLEKPFSSEVLRREMRRWPTVQRALAKLANFAKRAGGGFAALCD